MYAIMWLLLAGILYFVFDEILQSKQNPNRSVDTLVGADGVREVRLQRNKYGHYVTNGEINGQTVTFMLDTGATGVAIPDAIARELRLQRGQAFRVNTANGESRAYATRLDSVKVGDIELRDVRAGISPGYQSDQILLGMSFLKYVEFSQRGDTLTLRQYPQ